MISIHTPTKGATVDCGKTFVISVISIHTPTKGATGKQEAAGVCTIISIHTPTKGATLRRLQHQFMQMHFNPHSHEGSDVYNIHGGHNPADFNPHSHEGSGASEALFALVTLIFQSTLPRRERQDKQGNGTMVKNFNPHSHEGSGLMLYMESQQHLKISIHTPTKGAALLKLEPRYGNRYFNPHSHEGSGRAATRSGQTSASISIHTPTKGAAAILTNNFLIFCSISLINFILYLQIIQILFIFRYKFIFYFIF